MTESGRVADGGVATEHPELTMGRMVNWEFAATFGAKLARPAPPTTEYTRQQAIVELGDAARRAESPVREVTGLADGLAVPEARIIDRPSWIAAAAESMRLMAGGGDGAPGFVSGRVAGAQTGAVLAFISSGILGQYDPFTADGTGALLLVYPNIIAVERQLRVLPNDFRMWVCLHEVTHRVQFSANPWLAGYMSGTLASLAHEQEEDVTAMLGRLAEFVRSPKRQGENGIVDLLRAMQSEQGRDALDRLLVLGTLLEGHADHVMDAVGPAVVPSVSIIRSRFEARRSRKQPPLQRIIRALIGMDAKMRQYTRGKRFVDHVVGTVGMERFNTVWHDSETLPKPAEIENPDQWIARVL
ncbi:zinc-dependent metalloprotease [Mycobacterium sp. CBMA271]|uniref:zinc-dependent metalloprotease n=1 Tax=unclassified Mycobacteroides TaxID=2618759 RepID=UPI0012DE7E37|nr:MULTISPECIES: zinc-dependent metalloprotease [unclassified Mycobacteroides]MUM19554.1 hydrolase [Mycobacteroides sp. CBMA 326]MUM24156.1 zinc-dependent metalloprotease [Mycobacteroides sp. CBMA 271]